MQGKWVRMCYKQVERVTKVWINHPSYLNEVCIQAWTSQLQPGTQVLNYECVCVCDVGATNSHFLLCFCIPGFHFSLSWNDVVASIATRRWKICFTWPRLSRRINHARVRERMCVSWYKLVKIEIWIKASVWITAWPGHSATHPSLFLFGLQSLISSPLQ